MLIICKGRQAVDRGWKMKALELGPWLYFNNGGWGASGSEKNAIWRLWILTEEGDTIRITHRWPADINTSALKEPQIWNRTLSLDTHTHTQTKRFKHPLFWICCTQLHTILVSHMELTGQTCRLYNPMETHACNKIGLLNLGRHNSRFPELSE